MYETCQTEVKLNHQCRTENGIEKDEVFTITKVIGDFEQLEVTNQYGQDFTINPNQILDQNTGEGVILK